MLQIFTELHNFLNKTCPHGLCNIVKNRTWILHTLCHVVKLLKIGHMMMIQTQHSMHIYLPENLSIPSMMAPLILLKLIIPQLHKPGMTLI